MKTPVPRVRCCAPDSKVSTIRCCRWGMWVTLSSFVAMHAANAGAKPLPTRIADSSIAVARKPDSRSSSMVVSRPAKRGPLGRFLTRPTIVGPRFLDHGVLGVGVAGGFPHLYRLELALGILDYVTLGLTGHWLPGQSVPGWSPRIGLAFWRGRWFEAGAHYHQLLVGPPPTDQEAEEDHGREKVHWVLASATFSQYYVAAGFDLGLAYGLEPNPASMSDQDALIGRVRPAGGLHLRAGTRRWGFTLQALWPHTEAELVFDLRFGLFEKRARGGWRPEPTVELQPRSQY